MKNKFNLKTWKYLLISFYFCSLLLPVGVLHKGNVSIGKMHILYYYFGFIFSVISKDLPLILQSLGLIFMHIGVFVVVYFVGKEFIFKHSAEK